MVKWINISDKLPELYEDVLMIFYERDKYDDYIKAIGHRTEDHPELHKGTPFHWEGMKQGWIYNVEFWMKLPEFPEDLKCAKCNGSGKPH